MEKLVSTLGWVGNLLLAGCGVPAAVHAIWTGYSGVSMVLLVPWFLGEVITLLYIALSTRQAPLMVNYSVNIACILVMMYYAG